MMMANYEIGGDKMLTVAHPAGTVGYFYGACECGLHKYFRVGDQTYVYEEDESDGYRSYMGQVFIPDQPDLDEDKPIFQWAALDEVRIYTHNDDGNGIIIRSTSDEHVWLEIFTANLDDYYPTARYEYTPRPGWDDPWPHFPGED
jgi:hypothetical protein